MKNKKVLWIILGALDVAVVGFLFVIHVIMLANVIGKTPAAVHEMANGDGLIAYLAGHLDVYGFAFVLPLFLILAANIVGLVFYLKKNLKKGKTQWEQEKQLMRSPQACARPRRGGFSSAKKLPDLLE